MNLKQWAEREGVAYVTARRWFAWRKPSLTLAERTFTCQSCGMVLDRDVNASRNLLKLAASGAERVNACGGTVRPGPAGHDPVKQEPGAPDGDETGTVPRQRGTTDERQ